MDFMREFGELIKSVFEVKIECIQKKKTISYYQAALNRGEVVDESELQRYIQAEMAEYNRELERMVAENEAARSIERISPEHITKIKKLYRKLAKLIHPDINPKTSEIPELMSLWHMIIVAYNANDLEELESAEVLVHCALKEHNISEISIDIPNLDEKIEKIEEEMLKIKGTNPYQYKYLLSDKNLVAEKREKLEAELKEYRDYSKELGAVLEQMIREGAMIKWNTNWIS